jgi:hypothetical protein
MTRILVFLLISGMCNACTNGSLVADETNKTTLSSSSNSQKLDFIETGNIFLCSGNRLEINENVASFSSPIYPNSKKYSFDFLGFNREDGVFIIVDNENKMFTMIDLCSGKELIQYSSKHPIIGLYTFPTSRYFIETKQIVHGIEQKEVREIEPDLQRTMVVDLEAKDMTKLEMRSSGK